MKKIGIMTLWGNSNYGNRLQNYAVERLVESAGFEPVTFTFQNRNKSKDFVSFAKEKKSMLVQNVRQPKMRERRRNFDRFNETHLHPIGLEKFDNCHGYVCGSDQIWNYTFPEFSPEMFLNFSGEKPTASLSASFGVSTIPTNMKAFYSDGLSRIDFLSVREEEAVRIVSDLCSREATLLVDPTMAVERRIWDEAIEGRIAEIEPYVFTYFIGSEPAGLRERIGRELGISRIVSFNDPKSFKYYAADPFDFVSGIANAECIITDSFHGSVFSILYKKPFIVCDRVSEELSMSSRISTLLKTFDMGSNQFDLVEKLSDCRPPSESVDMVLNRERQRMSRFLAPFFDCVK